VIPLLWLALVPDTAITVAAGTFQQGSAAQPDAPETRVDLPAFGLDRAEVTVGAFQAWVDAGGYRDRASWSDAGWAWAQQHPDGAGGDQRAAGRGPDHPVVAVTWFEADAYCRAQGGRLPTESEWERAACGGQDRDYPWGDAQDVDAAWYGQAKHGHLSAVDTQPAGVQDAALASPEGFVHMAGNVWEWTASEYDPAGTWRVLRGGSYMNLPSYCACAHREPARRERSAFTTGFRCAWSP
jgi:iron(II)-dependent oxidoreductase